MVRSSGKRLPGLIASLVLNAVKLGRGSGILIASRRRGSRLDLELYYNGSGFISPHARGAFIELRRKGTEASELALGLAAIAHLSRTLGHSFAARSMPNGGHRFVLSMPLAEPALAVVPRR
jgi:K+-sensing histidine kinase KdpD